MKVFGIIEFIGAEQKTALVHHTHSSAFMDEDKIDDYAVKEGHDYLMPHYYDGRITFMQYHKEK